ncbi:hypothetical protein Tco_0243951, partial [Tanacetum coccineum]
GSRPALSISKMKAARYPDFGLELLVPKQMWIDEKSEITCEFSVSSESKPIQDKDLEYLRYGNKGSRPALSISKMKAARYPEFGLELLVPEQMWIDEVCTYDISAAYGNKDLEYLRYGNKGSRPALSISKMKAARYPNFGLELLVPEQM